MSWPADGLPRYIVTSEGRTCGIPSQDPRACGHVHDRGYCHRIVSTSRHKIEGSARREAEHAAAILNADEPL